MPFVSKRSKLKLDSRTIQELERNTKSRNQSASRIERAKIILTFNNQKSVSAIARELNINRPKVERCLNKAVEFGALNALTDLPRSGRKQIITDDARAWVISLACSKPKELGYSYEFWTTSLLAKHIRENCMKADYCCLNKLAKGTVSKILNRNKIKPHKIKYYLEKKDPDFDTKMAQVLIFYKTVETYREETTTSKQLYAFLSYDEKPGIQAIQNIAPDLKPKQYQFAEHARDYEYKRHGTLSFMAGIDLLSGKIIGQVTKRHRSKEFVEYLQKLNNEYPQSHKIKIILDNHSAHISKETRGFLKTVPNRFEFVFTPKHGSWLNIIESFFSKMARGFLRNIRVESLAELKERILLYLDEVNESPVIFRWKYKMDEVEV
jgi:transposase